MNKRAAGYRAHVMIGLIAVTLLLGLNYYFMAQQQDPSAWPFQFEMKDYLIIYFVALIFSQTPDIDSDVSVINKYFTTACLLMIVVSFLYNWIAVGIAITAMLLFVEWTAHRGIIHTVFAGVLLSAPLAYFNIAYAIAALTAHIVHLMVDGEFSLFTGRGFF